MRKTINEKKGSIPWRYSSEEAQTFVNILSFKIYKNTDILRDQEKSRLAATM